MAILNSVITKTKRLNVESKLCFSAALACFILGAAGWIINYFAADTTRLHGLLVVAVFYSMLGVINLLRGAMSNSTKLDSHIAMQRPVATNGEIQTELKKFESAA